IGTVPIADSYKVSVPFPNSYKIVFDDTSLDSRVKRVATGKNDKNFLPAITINVTNTGTQSLSGLKLEYKLRTKDGLIYPLKSTINETTVYQPLEEKEFLLTGVIPVQAGSEGWQLVVTQ